MINYVLVKANGEEDVAAVAKEIRSSGGHYSYHAVCTPVSYGLVSWSCKRAAHYRQGRNSGTCAQTPKFGPGVWKNGAEVRRWLAMMAPRGDLSAPEGSVHNPVQLQRCALLQAATAWHLAWCAHKPDCRTRRR